MTITRVTEERLPQAAAVYREAWRESSPGPVYSGVSGAPGLRGLPGAADGGGKAAVSAD